MRAAWALALAGAVLHAAGPFALRSEPAALAAFWAGLVINTAGLALLARAKGRPAWHAAVGLCPAIGPFLGIVLVGFMRYEKPSDMDASAKRLASLNAVGVAGILFGFVSALCSLDFLAYGAMLAGTSLCLAAFGGRRGWRWFPILPAGLGLALGTARCGADLRESALGAGPLRDLEALRARLAGIHGPEGEPPADLSRLGPLPAARLGPLHPDSSEVRLAAEPDDKGGWLYAPAALEDASLGLRVNCTHTDSGGKAWVSY